jgi:hypothetical protein
MAYSSYDRFGDVVVSGSGREADNQLASGCAAVIGRQHAVINGGLREAKCH